MPGFDSSALFQYPALAGRTRQASSQSALEALQNLDDPFRTMKSDQATQSGVSEWAPFFQSLQEQGVDRIRGPRPLVKPVGRAADPNNPLDALMQLKYPGAGV